MITVCRPSNVLTTNRSVYYDMPSFTQPHKSMLLRGARLPISTLIRSDIEVIHSRASRSGRGYSSARLDRGDRYRNQHKSIHYSSLSRAAPHLNHYASGSSASSIQGPPPVPRGQGPKAPSRGSLLPPVAYQRTSGKNYKSRP